MPGKFWIAPTIILDLKDYREFLKSFPGPAQAETEAILRTDELQSIRKEDDKKRQSRHFPTHPTSLAPGENNQQKLVLLKLWFLLPLPESEI